MASNKEKTEDKTPVVEKSKAPTFTVASGCAITSKKGILTGEVKPEYLEGGQQTIDDFVKSGHIVKN